MTEEDLDFRERLVAAQAQDEQLKGRYQKEILAMLDHKLNTPMKCLLMALTVLCLLAAAGTAINLRHLLARGDGNGELGIAGLVFELALAACLGWIVRRGAINRAAHGFTLAGIAGALSTYAACFLADHVLATPGIGIGLGVILVLGWLPMAMVTFSYYHNRTREKLLEIQYQLAELTEEIKRRR